MTTQPQSGRLPNTYLRQFFRFLGSRDSLLHDTAETATTLSQLGGSNSFQDYCQFFRNARAEFSEPAIGLKLGRINQISSMHGPLGTALYNSATIRDCLQIILRYGPLRIPVTDFHWIEESDLVGLEIGFKETLGNIHASVTEALLLSITNMLAIVSRHDIPPGVMEVDYPAPGYANDYQDAFQVTSIRFARPAIRILIPRQAAACTTDTDPDPQLLATALERCEELLKGSLRVATMSARVQQLFAENSGRIWSLEDIAQHMNMSARTLQRRLKDEGIHYRALQSQQLMLEARQLLADPRLSVESVALLLGYSDVSTFRQACRRWYGMSPNELRHQL